MNTQTPTRDGTVLLSPADIARVALAKLHRDGRPIPVLFGHDHRSIQAVLGMVPANGLSVDNRGLWAKGWIDVTTDVGARIHEMLRRDVLRWSSGFVPGSSRLDGNVKVFTQVRELLELSVVPLPANERTQTVGLKSHEPPTDAELRAEARRLGLLPDDRLRAATRDVALRLTAFHATKAAEPPEPSHAALERRLIAAGILTTPVTTHQRLDRAATDLGRVVLNDTNGQRGAT